MRDWNDSAYKELAAACRSEKGTCRAYLIERAQELFSLSLVSRANLTFRHAALLAAYTDLCRSIPRLAALEEDGKSCNFLDTIKMLHLVADLWRELGYDDLYAYYSRIYLEERSTHLQWVKAFAAHDLARTENELQPISGFASADMSEIFGQLQVARYDLIHVFQPEVLVGKNSRARLAMLRLERLAWELGEVEAAERWAGAIREYGLAPEHQAECREVNEIWRSRLARQIAMKLRPDALLDAAKAQPAGCRFQPGLIEAAAQLLLDAPDQDTRTAVIQALSTRLYACDTVLESCPPVAISRMKDLVDIASRNRQRLLILGARVINDGQIYAPLHADKLIAWALGLTLLETNETRALAKTLLDLRIRDVEYAAQADFSPIGATLRDTLRFEEYCKRYFADLARHQEPISLTVLEQFRNRGLLRRLQNRSRQAMLDSKQVPAGPVNPTVADQNTMLNQIPAMEALAQNSSDKLTAALGGALAEAMRYLVSETEINALASRATEALLIDDPTLRPNSWLSFDRLNLQLMQRYDPRFFAPESRSLGPDDSYLTWLRVNDGYVAILATPRAYEPHQTTVRFIEFTSADEQDLSIYLMLMQSGLGAARGGYFASTSQQAPLGKLPAAGLAKSRLWRLGSGHFAWVPSRPEGGAVESSFNRLQEHLSGRLLGAFTSDLKVTPRLIISPDAGLARLPFETLVLERKMLAQTKVVSYVQSLSLHAELKERAKNYKLPGKVLSIASPFYSAVKQKERDRKVPEIARSAVWPELPGTSMESKQLFNKYDAVDRWLGKQASRTHILASNASGQLASYSVIHFATHSYVDSTFSALVLSTAEGKLNAFLSTDDIADLKLRSALIILSACSTAFGKHDPGEGIVGLPHAFVRAGNINSIISLWPVDDVGTAKFIIEYTRRLRLRVPVQKALAETKIHFANGNMGRRFASPQVWAAFVALGVEMTLP
jgi:hypothetical protein